MSSRLLRFGLLVAVSTFLVSMGAVNGRYASPTRAQTPLLTWATRASMPIARSLAGAAVVGGKMYVIGGTNDQPGVLSAVEAYDPGTDRWSTHGPMPTARSRMAVVADASGAGGVGAATVHIG